MSRELKLRMKSLTGLKKNYNGVLLYNPDRWENPNFFWLSNVAVGGWLWVPFNGRPRLFTRESYREETKGSWAKVEYITKIGDVFSAIPKSRIGLDTIHMPVQALGRAKYRISGSDISAQLEAARAVKTKYEIKQIRSAARIAREIFHFIKFPSRVSEARLRADLDWEINNRGLEPAFPTIVASGAGIATPHHVPKKQAIRNALLVDMGVRFNGYCSDTTRTYGSKYATVIEKVFEAVEPLLKPGMRTSNIDAKARAVLGSRAKQFTTSLGHGLGIAVHESPNLSPKSKDTLAVGNVITVEPGIYVPNGIRHENMYLITKRGAENLTDF